MIAMAVVLAIVVPAQAEPPHPAPPATDDIVVVGERLKRLSIVVKSDRKTNRHRCVFKRRSGDPGLDQRVCTATLACFAGTDTKDALTRCLQTSIAALVPRPRSSVTPATPDR